MQLVAHHLAYLYVEPGQVWPLSITDSLVDEGEPRWRDGTPVAYAPRYQVADVLPGPWEQETLPRSQRIAAFFMLPDANLPGPAIVLFRGTNFRCDILTVKDPMGVAHDLDTEGVGYESFGANAATLHDWVEAAQQEGRGVVLVGHSLGAALATRLLASLSPEVQTKVRLLAFSPPGLETSCVESIAIDGAKVTTILHAGDYIPLAGHRMAPGPRIGG